MKIVTRKQANDQGLIHYYTGKPCVHGHLSQRYTRTYQCIACNKSVVRRKYAGLVEKYGEVDAKCMQRAIWRTNSENHRQRAGNKHTKYMREYMREYKKTPNGCNALYRAQKRYTDKQNAKIFKK